MKKRIVIKIGSSSIIKPTKINYEQIINLACGINKIKEEYDVLIVSSGAIALGKMKLNITPKSIKQKQACAAIGQASLIETYEKIFTMYQLNVAQILLNHDDFENRKRLVNLENTIDALLENGIIPIINENDALATEEIKVGDNDTLAALTASLINADTLVLCSDIDGLYDTNPNNDSNAKLIPVVEDVTKLDVDVSGKSKSSVGTGGMATKINAAKIVCSMGVKMIIMNAKSISELESALQNKIGSTFLPIGKMNKYQGWMRYNSSSKGTIVVDLGAKNALLARKSLLPSGILEVEGDYLANSIVDVIYENEVIAKGLSKYSSLETKLVKGKSLNYCLELFHKKEIIHADDLVLLTK